MSRLVHISAVLCFLFLGALGQFPDFRPVEPDTEADLAEDTSNETTASAKVQPHEPGGNEVLATVNSGAGKLGYGNPCLTNDQCSSRLGFACITTGAPIASKCQCARETPIFITDTDGVSKCVRVKSLYESCMSDLECNYHSPNMQCVDFLCYCPLPYELTENQQCTPRKSSRASVLLTAVPTLLLLLTLLVFGASYSYQRLSRATKDKGSCSGRRDTCDASTDVEWRPDTVSTASSSLPRHARLSSAFHSKIDPRQRYYLKYGEHASWGYARVPRHPPRYIKRSRDAVDPADTPGSTLFVFKNGSSISRSDRETKPAASMIAPIHQMQNTPPALMRTYDDVSVRVLPKYKPAIITTKTASEGRIDPRQTLEVKRASAKRIAYPKELKDLLHMREVVVSVEPVRSVQSAGMTTRKISPTFQRRVVPVGRNNSNISTGKISRKQHSKQDMRPTSAAGNKGGTSPLTRVPGTDPGTKSEPEAPQRNTAVKAVEEATSHGLIPPGRWQSIKVPNSECCFASTTPFGTCPDTKSSGGESSGINYPHTKPNDTAMSQADSPEKVHRGSVNFAGPCSKTSPQPTSLGDEISDGVPLDAKPVCDTPVDNIPTSSAKVRLTGIDSSPRPQVQSLGSKTADSGQPPQFLGDSVNSGSESTAKRDTRGERINKSGSIRKISPACDANVRDTLIPSERALDASESLPDKPEVACMNLNAEREFGVQESNAKMSALDNEVTRSFSIEMPPAHTMTDIKVEVATHGSEKSTEENVSVAEQNVSMARLRMILSAADDISVDVTAEPQATLEASNCHLSSDDRAGLDNIDDHSDKDGAKHDSESIEWPDTVSRRARESVTESSPSQSRDSPPDEVTGAFLVRAPHRSRTKEVSKQAEQMVAGENTALNKGGAIGIFAKLLTTSYNIVGEVTEPTVSISSRACSREGLHQDPSKEMMRGYPAGTTDVDASSVSTVRSAASTSSTFEASTATDNAQILFDIPAFLLKSFLQLTESDQATVELPGRGSSGQITFGDVAPTPSQEDSLANPWMCADAHTQTPLQKLRHIPPTSTNQDFTQHVGRPQRTNRRADFIHLISLGNQHYTRERPTPPLSACSTVLDETQFIVQRIAYPNAANDPHTPHAGVSAEDAENACYQYINPEAQPLRLQDIILLQHPVIRTILPLLPSRSVHLHRASQTQMPEPLRSRMQGKTGDPDLNTTGPVAHHLNTDDETELFHNIPNSGTHEPDAPQATTSGNSGLTSPLPAEHPMSEPVAARSSQSTTSSVSALGASNLTLQSLYTTRFPHNAETIQIIDAISSELPIPAVPQETVRSVYLPSTTESLECKSSERLHSPDSYKARGGSDFTQPGSSPGCNPQQPSSPRDGRRHETSHTSYPTNVEEPCFEFMYNAILQSQGQRSSSPGKLRNVSPKTRPQQTSKQDNSWPQVASPSAPSVSPPGIAPSSQGHDANLDTYFDATEQNPQRRRTNNNELMSSRGKDREALPFVIQRGAPPAGNYKETGQLTITTDRYDQKEGTGSNDALHSPQTSVQRGPVGGNRHAPSQFSSYREAPSASSLEDNSKYRNRALKSSSCPGFESRQQSCRHDEKQRPDTDDKA